MELLLLLGASVLCMALVHAEGEGEEGTEGDPSAETKKTEEPMIPKKRLDEVIAQRKDLETRLAEIEAKEKKAEEDRLAQQSQWEELARKHATERDEALNLAATLRQQIAAGDRQRQFNEVAFKQGIPPDRVQDAFLLASWPAGEEEPDYGAIVKQLIKEKPYLVPTASSPNTNPEGGRGPGVPTANQRNNLNRWAQMFLPTGNTLASTQKKE